MSDEDILRNKLDRLNQNSHYGLMIDTEITKIVRDHIKIETLKERLEENEMEPTSVWKIENIDNIWITLDGDEISLLLKNRDDLTKIILTGDAIKNHNDNFITTLKVDMEENAKIMCEKDQKIRGLEEKVKRLERDNMFDKETADYWSKEYYDLSEKFAKLQEEKDQKIRELEEKSKDVSDDNALLLETNKKLREDNEKLKKSNLPETPITDTMLVDDYNRLAEENKALKKELALEKAANEAQHKFVREYAGKQTEVPFNYAIDDTKEVSYVIVDRKENTEVRSKILKYIEMNNKLRDENEELKYQLSDIQATKEVVEQKLDTREGILDQAKKCVCGQREQDYGTPESNFQLIADLWNDYLKKEQSSIVVDAMDVSMMMALLKIARIRNGGGSGDSFVDLAGYAACGGEIWHGGKA